MPRPLRMAAAPVPRCWLTLQLDGDGELVLPGRMLSLPRAWQFLFASPQGPVCSIVAQVPAPCRPAGALRGAILLGDLPACHGIRSGRCLLERLAPGQPADDTVIMPPTNRSISLEGLAGSLARGGHQLLG